MNKNYWVILFSIIYLCLMPYIVIAPPQPHNIKGRIFNSNGATGVDNGIPVFINNTNNSNSILTYTNAPPAASLKGSYSAAINGSDGDIIIITAWNGTQYGWNTTTLASGTTNANVVLNTTRPSETNVTIITPMNNSVIDLANYFNVTARIAAIGGQEGVECSANITFSNINILKLAPGENSTHGTWNISLGSFVTTMWNISGNLTGNSNITIRTSCISDGINLDNLDSYTISNITIQDAEAPMIRLEYPINNSKFTVSNDPIIFRYNVSDGSNIANCSLIINGALNQTNYTVTKEVSQNFSVVLTNNTYNWSVDCTDNSTSYNTGSSPFFNLTIIPNMAPTITNMVIDNPIDLTIGSTKIVFCNATVYDENNISDIININSTFHHSSVEVLAINDNNNHYTNNSCRNVSTNNYEINVSCSFDVYYYANNGSWICNISAVDNSDAFGSNNKTTTINDLLAIDISPSIIDYGELEAGQISLEDFKVNITNLGNIDFNITLEGYGLEDGDGLAMDCVKGDIPLMYEKYDKEEGQSYNEMINLTDTPLQIGNITVLQRTNDTTYKNDRNFTYWKMGVPGGTSGICTGYVRFVAIST